MNHTDGKKMVKPVARLIAVAVIIGGALSFCGGCSSGELNERPAGQEINEESGTDMNTTGSSERRVYLYFSETPSSGQLEDLEEMGVTVFSHSWVPPAGAHPAGFLLADIPADKLKQVEALEFIVRVELAEEIIPLPDTMNQPPERHIPDREGDS